jgi:hypothetical protein
MAARAQNKMSNYRITTRDAGESESDTDFLEQRLQRLYVDQVAMSRLLRATELKSLWCSNCGHSQHPNHFCRRNGCPFALCKFCRNRDGVLIDVADSPVPETHFDRFDHEAHAHQTAPLSWVPRATLIVAVYAMPPRDHKEVSCFFEHGLTRGGVSQWGLGMYVYKCHAVNIGSVQKFIAAHLPMMARVDADQVVIVWMSHHDPTKAVTLFGDDSSISWAGLGLLLRPLVAALSALVTPEHTSVIIGTCEASPLLLAQFTQMVGAESLAVVISFARPAQLVDEFVLLTHMLQAYMNALFRAGFNDGRPQMRITLLQGHRPHATTTAMMNRHRACLCQCLCHLLLTY